MGVGEGKACSSNFPINQMFSLTFTSLKYFKGEKKDQNEFGMAMLVFSAYHRTHPNN